MVKGEQATLVNGKGPQPRASAQMVGNGSGDFLQACHDHWFATRLGRPEVQRHRNRVGGATGLTNDEVEMEGLVGRLQMGQDRGLEVVT